MIKEEKVNNEISVKNRLYAFFFDLFFFLAVSLLFFVPFFFVFILYSIGVYSMSYNAIIALLITSIVVSITFFFLYYMVIPFRLKGSSLGGRIFLVKTMNMFNQEVSLKMVILKELIFVLIFIITFGLSLIVDLIIILCSSKHLSLTDVITKTKVIKIKH